MEDNNQYITELLNRRTDLIQLILVATVLSLGTNLLASWIGHIEQLTPYVWSLSLILIIFSIAWVAIILLRKRYFYSKIEAAFLLDVKNNQVLSLSGYDFARDFYLMLRGGLRENKAFQEIWNVAPLVVVHKDPKKKTKKKLSDTEKGDPRYVVITKVNKNDKDEEPKSYTLVSETVEFLILHELSMHLSDYFNGREHQEKYIREYKREDIADILQQNRILDLLTKPFEEREPFIEFMKENPDLLEEDIHTILGTDGSIYDKFHLQLPVETTFRRLLPGMLELETNRLSMLITVALGGFSNSLMSDVVSLYKRKDPDEVVAYKVNIGLHCRVKARSLISWSGWKYYQWVESFLSKMTKKLSVDLYLERLNWNTVALIHEIMRNEPPSNKGTDKRAKDN